MPGCFSPNQQRMVSACVVVDRAGLKVELELKVLQRSLSQVHTV